MIDAWLPLENENAKIIGTGSMRPTEAIEERTWLYRSGGSESEEGEKAFRVLPNG
jgi:hypothetical protein